MDEYNEHHEHNAPEEMTTGDHQGPHGMFWLAFLVLIVVIGIAGAIYNSYQQKNTISQLTAQTSNMNSTIGQLQNQLNDTTTKLNDVSATQTATAQAAAAQAAANAAKPAARPGAPGASRAELNRVQQQLQSGLDDQQKQLQSTQDDVAKTRSDLQGNLDTTRDQLNGSIAKTHDELVLLEKRGEHRYFEFDLARSKQFMREGPLSLMVRRSDPKHANIDLAVLVNDKQITKKHVNLYEPVSIYETDGGEPLQVVVNKIDSKGVHGYVSTPRYSAADLSASAAPAAAESSTSSSTTTTPTSTPSTNTNSSDSTTGGTTNNSTDNQ